MLFCNVTNGYVSDITSDLLILGGNLSSLDPHSAEQDKGQKCSSTFYIVADKKKKTMAVVEIVKFIQKSWIQLKLCWKTKVLRE